MANFIGEIRDPSELPQEFERELKAEYKRIVTRIFDQRFEGINEDKGYRYCNFNTMPLN